MIAMTMQHAQTRQDHFNVVARKAFLAMGYFVWVTLNFHCFHMFCQGNRMSHLADFVMFIRFIG
jgi:hypothetical protein